MNAELRWLIGELGPARDWDVFLAETLAPMREGWGPDADLDLLEQAAARRRDESYATAQAAIRSRRYTALLLRLGAWVEGRGWRDAAKPEALATLDGPAKVMAAAVLHRRHEKLRKAGRHIKTMSTEERHRLRIQVKKLRYATEFMGTLYPRRKVTKLLVSLKGLQDCLGSLNDLSVAREQMMTLTTGARRDKAARLAFAAGLVIGWHGHAGGAREDEVVGLWRRFSRRKPFWNGAS